MKRTIPLAALEAISRLQQVRVSAAQGSLVRAQEGLQQADAAAVTRGKERDEAVSAWLETFTAERPDPNRISLARAWLAGKEAALEAARLDRSIASRKASDAATAVAQRKAECDASDAVAAGLRKRIRRGREERQAILAGDLFLQRRGR